MSSSDRSYLLHKFLFHLRGALSSIKSASQMSKYHPEKLSVSALNWLEKWMPTLERWKSDEEKSHVFFHDGEEHDWEQILDDMAENMKDISIAYTEAKEIEAPKSGEGEWVILIEWVIESVISGSEHLNKVVQSVRNKDYHYLLQH